MMCHSNDVCHAWREQEMAEARTTSALGLLRWGINANGLIRADRHARRRGIAMWQKNAH